VVHPAYFCLGSPQDLQEKLWLKFLEPHKTHRQKIAMSLTTICGKGGSAGSRNGGGRRASVSGGPGGEGRVRSAFIGSQDAQRRAVVKLER
jgi:hypothetical protein